MNEIKEKELEKRIEELERNKWEFKLQDTVVSISIAILTFLASCIFIAMIVAIVARIVSMQ